MIDYALAGRLYRKHKAALTRAKNSDDAENVIATCDRFFADFYAHDLPLPDDWALWEIARQDAELTLRRLRPGW